MNLLDNYELVESTIRSLYDSKLRLAILDALSEQSMPLSDLRRKVDANAPNTSSKAKDLENMGLLTREKGDYKLTEWGQAVHRRTEKSISFFSTYEKHKEFWNNHITSGIPSHLWDDLGALDESLIVTPTVENVIEVHDSFKKLLAMIKERFYGVSPIYHREWFDLLLFIVENGIDTKIVFSPSILHVMQTSPTKEEIAALDKADNAEFFLYDTTSLDVAFTVSETYLSMGLRSKTIRDQFVDADLQSWNPKAVDWGLRLFEYYKSKSKLVKLTNYL